MTVPIRARFGHIYQFVAKNPEDQKRLHTNSNFPIDEVGLAQRMTKAETIRQGGPPNERDFLPWLIRAQDPENTFVYGFTEKDSSDIYLKTSELRGKAHDQAVLDYVAEHAQNVSEIQFENVPKDMMPTGEVADLWHNLDGPMHTPIRRTEMALRIAALTAEIDMADLRNRQKRD